jgi:hypothetical protein
MVNARQALFDQIARFRALLELLRDIADAAHHVSADHSCHPPMLSAHVK